MRRIILIFIISLISSSVFSQSASDIVRRANDKTAGNSQYAEITMRIIRPRWQKEIKISFCSLQDNYSLVLINSPVRDKGQSYLKVKNEMWMWSPAISRIIKLGPSMMSQGWMGSDYSNDELLNSGSITSNYNSEIIGTDTINGQECYKIRLTPKQGTTIIWGKQILWITKKTYLILKNEFYDEDDFLVKTHSASDIKIMDGREIPTKITVIPIENPQNKTVVLLKKIKFNVDIKEDFFTQQNMRRGENIKFPKTKN